MKFCNFSKVFYLFNIEYTTPLYEIIFDSFYIFKNYAYFKRFFAAIHLIQRLNKTPLSLVFIKNTFYFLMFRFSLFYFVKLTENTSIILIDFYRLVKVSKEFNLICVFLYICSSLQLNQVYLNSNNSDYTQLLYQAIILKNDRLFLQKTTSKGKNLCSYIQKVTIYFANSLAYCGIITGIK